NYPKKLLLSLENKKNKKLIDLKNIILEIEKKINTEKISQDLKDNGKIYIIIENEKCFGEKTKTRLQKLRINRLDNVLEFENIKKNIIIISDKYDYDKFDKRKIKSVLPDDLKYDLNKILLEKKKITDIQLEFKNINDWNEELIEKLENHYKPMKDHL
ncbi:328_t:CDS:1, partial [Cetraspora pellucida]